MVGNSNSGRKKEAKTNATPYKAISLSGKQFSSLITNKPLNMPDAVEISPLEQSTAEVKKAVNDRIESWAIIKKAQMSGMPTELIDEMKLQLGLTKEEEKNDQPMDQKDIMLMKMISEEDDPQMKQLYMMSLFGKGKNAMDPMTMSMVMNSNKKKDSDGFMEKLAMKFIEGKTDNKSDIDKGMEMFDKMKKYFDDSGQKKNALDEIIEQKEKLEKLGLVQDPSGSIADREMDLKFKRLELEHERVVSEQEAKTGGQEEIMKAASQGISALLGALGHFAGGDKSKQSEGPSQQEMTNDQIGKSSGNKIMFKCSNPECKSEFPVVMDKDRTLSCPNGKCKWTYKIENKQAFLTDESEQKMAKIESSSSNEPDIKLET